ncbi:MULTISPECIES: helix-turn-helix domain-containing protein [Streptomyces]|uniref:HTH cro/C1-type domain-containing protein n=1 Tax=Streptomyces indiaensis TaxID=284033 RepID=A0ABP5QZI8_9ACTN|nr:helix-turn-helix transcriptional regulator [Streptomyces indiaensis]MCF1645381.1 helix-turn-helix transcriptional regulator [Streptomyces indiaensis]
MCRCCAIEASSCASQIHRLVSGTPERLSLQVLAAFRDIFACTPADLVATSAENAGVRKTATGDVPAPPSAVASPQPPSPNKWLRGEDDSINFATSPSTG